MDKKKDPEKKFSLEIKEDEDSESGSGIPIGVCLGCAIGIMLWQVTGSIAYIGMGMGFGLLIGTCFLSEKGKGEKAEEAQTEEKTEE